MSTRTQSCVARSTLAALALLAAGPLSAADPTTGPASSPAASASVRGTGTAEETELCRKNLQRIHEAIQAYRADRKEAPNWLSDLVPKYLDDVNVLLCPVTKRTGQVQNYGLADPKIATSYLYEFCPEPVPSTIGGGSKRTMREWKEKQMSLVGDVVPIVRCHHHSPQLNLSVGGQIYGSTGTWEAMFTNKVNPNELTVSRLFPGESPAPAPATKPGAGTSEGGGGGGANQIPVIIRIPPRDPQAPSSLVDLTDYYNAGLNEGWHRVTSGDALKHSDLSWLPKGVQSFAGTEFDVRGVIQLAGQALKTQRFPPAVKGIRVNRKCSTLHFLHGTGWSVPDGTRIGHYRVVYSGGDDAEIPLVYGVELRDWHMKANEGPEPTNSVVAWMGKSPATQAQGTTLRLFKTAWENPRTQLRIETIDYVSAMTNSAPFLIAITAE